MSEGFVSEIFSGIQGEGLLVGERQVFIRFAGCNLRCAYCDTPASQVPTESCRIEQTSGKRDFLTMKNPVTAQQIAEYALRLTHHSSLITHHPSLVLTGGEPLVQPGFVAQAASLLKENGIRIMLETNGSLPDALADVLPFIDVVSMDIKLPSVTGGPDLLREHEQFLRKAMSKDVYVKIVVASGTSLEELLAAAEMISSVDCRIPLVLQPVTSQSDCPSPLQVLDWQAQCLAIVERVLVIPQCHKILGQM